MENQPKILLSMKGRCKVKDLRRLGMIEASYKYEDERKCSKS
jgi:hypothetical protein